MAMLGKKSGKFDIKGIEGLAKGKPVVYGIKDDKGKVLYVGVAKRGRVHARLKEHLPGGVGRAGAGRCASSHSTKGEHSGS